MHNPQSGTPEWSMRSEATTGLIQGRATDLHSGADYVKLVEIVELFLPHISLRVLWQIKGILEIILC
jgi:hypothetical protein